MNKQIFNTIKSQHLFTKYHVDLCLLHGSQVTGQVHANSDIDIAIQVKDLAYQDKVWGIVEDLKELLNNQNVDVTLLHKGDPLINYLVAIKSELLFEKQSGDYQRFVLRSIKRYQDTKKFRDLEKVYLSRL